jgi:hypothetical protein
MNEYSLQRVAKLIDKIDRIVDAALRTARTDQAAQDLRTFKQDLFALKAGLSPTPIAATKPGAGKGGEIALGAAILVGFNIGMGARFLALVGALVVLIMLAIYILAHWDELSQSAGQFWNEIVRTYSGITITTLELARRLAELERQFRDPRHPCRDNFERIREPLRQLVAFAGRRPVDRLAPSYVSQIIQASTDLATGLESLIFCLDPTNSSGMLERLCGNNGVIRVVINMLTRFYIRIQHPGAPAP